MCISFPIYAKNEQISLSEKYSVFWKTNVVKWCREEHQDTKTTGWKLYSNRIITWSPSIIPDYLLITKEKGNFTADKLEDITLTKWSQAALPVTDKVTLRATCCDTVESTQNQLYNIPTKMFYLNI